MPFRRSMFVLLVACLLTSVTHAAEVDDLIKTITAVGPKGDGNAAASKAVDELSQAGPDVLVDLLEAYQGANPLAVNWLQVSFAAIADRTIKEDPQAFPAEALITFVRDRAEHPRARWLAYQTLQQAEALPEHEPILQEMITDPGAEFRREAVARLIKQADALKQKGEKTKAKEVYRQALVGAVDNDQVKAITKPLGELGVDVDLQKHFGFLTDWHVIGPFDNKDMQGFDVAYPPEKQKVDLSATYDGQLGPVQWEPYSTDDEYGEFDIAALTKPHKGAIDYLTTTFHSDEAQDVVFRLGTANAYKVWLNGELLFGREEYHRSKRLDQYHIPGHLKAGENRILMKVCQNEQEQDWAQDWTVQFRVADQSGRAVLPSK